MKKFMKLHKSFYNQETIQMAKAFLGKILVYNSEQGLVSGRIVETEAYLHNDPACHASRGMTKRNQSMFGEAGHTYVYFTYGCHYCLNIVTNEKGVGEGVLIRALIPIDGIDIMQRNRQKDKLKDLCSGPGKLTKAFGIDTSNNLTELSGDIIYLVDDGYEPENIIAKPRIGITEAVDEPWRFYPSELIDWVSKK